jgi:hypothetical protein
MVKFLDKSSWLDCHMPFITESRARLPIGLRQSVALCKSGMNRGDKGSLHRLLSVSTLAGIVLPSGVVVAEPESEGDRPKNTTRLKVPTAMGTRSTVVNCVRRVDDSLYKLARYDARDLCVFDANGSLVPYEDEEESQLMVGITWTQKHDEKGDDAGMTFVVRLLDGVLDFEHRLFTVSYFENLVSYNSAQDEVRVFESAQPTGPELVLKPKSDNEGQ